MVAFMPGFQRRLEPSYGRRDQFLPIFSRSSTSGYRYYPGHIALTHAWPSSIHVTHNVREAGEAAEIDVKDNTERRGRPTVDVMVIP